MPMEDNMIILLNLQIYRGYTYFDLANPLLGIYSHIYCHTLEIMYAQGYLLQHSYYL